MIEAVNSTIANASLLRGNVEQQDSSRSFGADPERVQQAAPKAPYISPYISVDVDSNTAVLQIRDSDTGDVINQFPSESRIRAQSAAQELESSGGAQETGGADSTGSGSGDVVGGSNVALAQQASVALSTGAQAGVESLSAGVTVFA